MVCTDEFAVGALDLGIAGIGRYTKCGVGVIQSTAHIVHATRRRTAGRSAQQLEALLRAATWRGSAPGAPPTRDRLADAYAALGITPDVSGAEVKRAYRKLISENHPDKLASRGLPESMRQVAEERSREINAAYDLIKESRSDVK